MTPHDLPAGFAEDRAGRGDYLRMRIERGHGAAQKILDRELRDGFSTLLFDPAPGRVYDAGLEHYGEFFCSLPDAVRHLEDGFTMNGQHGTATVVMRFTNGAQLRWKPDGVTTVAA